MTTLSNILAKLGRKRRPHIEVLRGKSGLWTWHVVAGNGRVWQSGETYGRRPGAESRRIAVRAANAFGDVTGFEVRVSEEKTK